MNNFDKAIQYFEKQRQLFLNKSKNIDKDFEAEIEYCSIAIKAMNQQKKKEDAVQQTEAFKAFWVAYPKKVGKPSALKAFKKIDPDEGLLNKIIKAIQENEKSNQWIAEEGQYIPYPATWLNDRRWEDIENNSGNPEQDNTDFIAKSRKTVPRFR